MVNVEATIYIELSWIAANLQSNSRLVKYIALQYHREQN